METPTRRIGVLVVNAWSEDGTAATLRARLTQSTDARSPQLVVTSAAGIDGIGRVFRNWLEELVAS